MYKFQVTSMLIAKVRESPNVTEPNSITKAREQEVPFRVPASSFKLLFLVLVLTIIFIHHVSLSAQSNRLQRIRGIKAVI